MQQYETYFFGVTAAIQATCIAVEAIVSAYNHRGWYEKKDTITNLSLTGLNAILDLAFKGIAIYALTLFVPYHIFQIRNFWIYWVSLVLLEDLMFWVLHYVDHHVRFFWAIHVTHHSSEKFNLTTAIRSSLFQPLYRFIYYIPLVLLGFDPLDIFFAFAICNFWGFFIHTEAIGKLGFIEHFMATPSNHRVHHASNPPYLDKNLGQMFVLWDRIFGTYVSETEPVHFGLTKHVRYDYLPEVILNEWRQMWKDVSQAPSLKNKMMYIFGPPGWSHDGSRMTSKQLQQAYFKKTN